MRDLGFQPEGCKLLVKVEKVSEKTEGGIYLAPKGREDEQMGTVRAEVMAIGPRVDIEFESGVLELGDIVIFAKYGGNVVEDKRLDGVWRVLNDEDILIRISKD
jgi:co-chaperonin GroES (HSP10)